VPAAAVIPAPIAYIKVVAVKKLVVEFLGRAVLVHFGATWRPDHPREDCGAFTGSRILASFTVRKLECLKQAFSLNTLAWNNEIGLRCYFVGCAPE
jgi:hypothetical protein